MYGASGNQGIGLPYDPEGMMPAYGGLAESSIGKMYDVLPTGMTRSAMGGGAKVPKSYEILPGADTTAQGCGGKNDECGCGGSCGGEKSASVMSLTGSDAVSTLPGVGMDIDSMFKSISRLGPESGQGYGASLCEAIRRRIEWLQAEIDRRMEQLGPRRTEIADAWRNARSTCLANEQNWPGICKRLLQQQEQAGRALGNPQTAESIGAYNAAVRAAGACRANAPFEGRRFFACAFAIQHARMVERRAAEEQMMSPPVSYLGDILPMEQELDAKRIELANCQRAAGVPSAEPPGPQCIEFCQGKGPGCSSCCERSCFSNEVAECKRQCGGFR